MEQTYAETSRKDLSQDSEPLAEKPRGRKGANHAKEAVEDQGQVREQAWVVQWKQYLGWNQFTGRKTYPGDLELCRGHGRVEREAV